MWKDQTYLKLVYTPDNWPNENEIVVGGPNGTIFYAPQGTYNLQMHQLVFQLKYLFV
tara:strand:- start:2180 stop:2350 length:171 start_codon:yes stop_codon:yes gene_type:complete